jgi:hypothetical protein
MMDATVSRISPNVNCLDGKRCPKCGSYGPFEVIVSMRVLLYDNGTSSAEDATSEYGEEAHTKCYSCRHEGQFGDFDE